MPLQSQIIIYSNCQTEPIPSIQRLLIPLISEKEKWIQTIAPLTLIDVLSQVWRFLMELHQAFF